LIDWLWDEQKNLLYYVVSSFLKVYILKWKMSSVSEKCFSDLLECFVDTASIWSALNGLALNRRTRSDYSFIHLFLQFVPWAWKIHYHPSRQLLVLLVVRFARMTFCCNYCHQDSYDSFTLQSLLKPIFKRSGALMYRWFHWFRLVVVVDIVMVSNRRDSLFFQCTLILLLGDLFALLIGLRAFFIINLVHHLCVLALLNLLLHCLQFASTNPRIHTHIQKSFIHLFPN